MFEKLFSKLSPPCIENYQYASRDCFYRSEKLEISPEEMKTIKSIVCEAVSPVEIQIPDEPVKVIIDTDIGTDLDDSLALLYALRLPNVEILGVTTNYGPTKLRAAIVKKICELHWKLHPEYPKFPIVWGASRQIGTHREIFLFGNEGSGLFTQEEKNQIENEKWKKAKQTNAADFIIETILSHPNQVKILSIGIPTNIGLALKKRPDIAGLINEIVAMGGGGYIYDNPQGRAKISYYKQNEPWTEDYNMKVEPPFPLPTPSNSEKRDTNETENNNENNSNEMPNFVINGNIVHLFPNHNFSGDTIASKIMFDTPDLRIRIIPHAVTSKFWLTGRSIEHLKNKSQELFDKSLELKFREPTQPSQVVGINLYEWFIRRNGNGNGQCPHDPLTVHEAAFGSDLSSAKYIPGTFIIHKWAAYATFVPHNDGKHLLGIEAINPDDFLNQLTSVLIEKD